MSFIKNLFSSPEAPSVPDPAQTIAAQGAANVEAARVNAKLNRPDTFTPFGSVIFEDLGDDRSKATQTLSPALQGIFDTQLDVGQGINDAALTRVEQLDNTPFNFDDIQGFQQDVDRSGFTGIPGEGDFDAARLDAENAVFQRFSNLFNPEVDRDRDRLTTRLANQGVTRGSDAFIDEFDQFDRRVSEARTAAGFDAVGAGQNIFNNLFANSLTARQQQGAEAGQDIQLANVGRQQAISDRLLERGQPINELAALLQGSPAINAPQPINTAQVNVAPPDIGAAQGLSLGVAQNNFNQATATQNASLGGLFGLGSAGILAQGR